MRIVRSLAAPDALAKVVDARYDLGAPAELEIISIGDNDNYLVSANGSRYVLRVYVQSRHWAFGEAEHRFELEWLLHLRERGIDVASPVATRAGDVLAAVEMPEGQRNMAMFTFAAGDAEALFASADRVRAFGRNIARLHSASEDFVPSRGARFAADLEFLVDRPAARVRRYLDRLGRTADISRVDAVVETMTRAIARLPQSAPAWGVIGGDFNCENQHVNDDGNAVMFDFDLCSYGWRAYDLAVFLCHRRRSGLDAGFEDALLAGYEEERPLNDAERAAMPSLVKARQMWIMGEHVADVATLGSGRLGHHYWDRAISLLEQL